MLPTSTLQDVSTTSDAILDTSVLINLLGTGFAREILSSFEFRCLIDKRAMAEVTKHPRPNADLKAELDTLIKAAVLKKIQLSDDQLDDFVALTGARSPNDIGDGEAATLVQASAHGAVAIIDDRKAARIGRACYSHIFIGTTADLLLHESVVSRLGAEKLAQAFLDTRNYSRMLIPKHCGSWFDNISKKNASAVR